MIKEKKYIVTDADGNPIEFNDPVSEELVSDEPLQINIDDEKFSAEEESGFAKMAKTLRYNDKIVCLGDDITYGFGVKADECWVGIMNKKYGTNLINRGMVGDPTVNLLYRFDKHVIPENPKAVIIMGGSNDLIGEIPMEYTTQNLADICEKAYNAGILPIMTISPEPSHNDVAKEWKEQANYAQVMENYAYLRQWILFFCEANDIPLIDFDYHMKARLRERYGTFFLNGVHPDINGYRIMAQIADEFFISIGAKDESDKFSL